MLLCCYRTQRFPRRVLHFNEGFVCLVQKIGVALLSNKVMGDCLINKLQSAKNLGRLQPQTISARGKAHYGGKYTLEVGQTDRKVCAILQNIQFFAYHLILANILPRLHRNPV